MATTTAPVAIPSSRGSTPPPLRSGDVPPLDADSPRFRWRGSPESANIATPQTPATLAGITHHHVPIKSAAAANRTGSCDGAYAAAGTSYGSTTSVASSSYAPRPGGRHRRGSSMPFPFELGDPAIEEHASEAQTPEAAPPAFGSHPILAELGTSLDDMGASLQQPTPPDPAATAASSTPVSMTSTPPTPGSLGAAVRRQIRRSKTSLRRLYSEEGEGSGAAAGTNTPGAGAGASTPDTPVPRSRLKSLITRGRARAQSLGSLSSTQSSLTPSVSSSAQLSALESVDSYDDGASAGAGAGAGQRGAKGKRIVANARQRLLLHRRRSTRVNMHLGGTSGPPFNVVLSSAGLQSPTEPLPTDELVWGTLSYRAPLSPLKVNHFGTMLPRELKVAVFRALVDSWVVKGGPGRWDGVNGGRRELVRLSRVSKEWQSLCFDGQLWSSCDFTAFATVMSPATLGTILMHARPCVKSLAAPGHDALSGAILTGRPVPSLNAPPAGYLYPQYTSLTTLDLRGCHSVMEADLIDLLGMSPGLKRLNLKGSRVATIYTLDALRNKVDALEELDVSHCWQLRFLDVERYIVSLSVKQQATLRTLRIAGLPNASGGHLMQRIPSCLPNLECLNLMGCSWIGVSDLQEYVAALGDEPSTLQHLVISSCTGLSPEAIELLVGRVPEMRLFEAANLEAVFYLDPPPTLSRLVRSMPKLERLDLDGTGRYGGVEDQLLHELIPGACRSSPLETSNLVELRIGNAKFVSKGAIMRVVKELPELKTLVADGTEADDAVMREWHKRHLGADTSISLVDCGLTAEAYDKLAARTRPRGGWDDYRAAPFQYAASELAPRPVVRAFWAWRRVGVPPLWRDARQAGERDLERRVKHERAVAAGVDGTRRGSWWRHDDIDMERGACVVM